jgi:formiminoglutamase
MDLKLFFDPLDHTFDLKKLPNSAIAHSLFINQEQLPELDRQDIALIGIREARGADPDQQEGISLGADEIRRSFYSLKKGAETLKILDLGNFRNGPELEDTYLRLKEVCGFLMSQNILPVLIGGAHNVDLGQFYAYEDQDKLITLLNIDSLLDLEDPKTGIASHTHIHKIFRHDPNFL